MQKHLELLSEDLLDTYIEKEKMYNKTLSRHIYFEICLLITCMTLIIACMMLVLYILYVPNTILYSPSPQPPCKTETVIPQNFHNAFGPEDDLLYFDDFGPA